MVILITRGFIDFTPEVAGIDRGDGISKFWMLYWIADGELGVENGEILRIHTMTTEANGGHNRGHLRSLEIFSDILDKISKVFLILSCHFRRAILMTLPPGEAGEFVSLALITGDNFSDIGEGLLDAFDHEFVFQSLPLIPRVSAATGGWAEVEAEGAIAHRGFNQEDLLLMESPEDVTEGEFRADSFTV